MTRMRIIGLWARFISSWLALTCNLRYEVKGLENLPLKAGVIMSKHQSAWETIVFQVIFPPQTWALKREALWLPFFGWGLAATSPIAINRATRVQALEQLIYQGKKKNNARPLGDHLSRGHPHAARQARSVLSGRRHAGCEGRGTSSAGRTQRWRFLGSAQFSKKTVG